MKIKYFGFVVAFLFLVTSCKKKNVTTENDYNKGEITILTDDSFKSVTEALAQVYTINYPDTKVNVEVVKEDLALMQLLKQKAKLIVMSRDLTPAEIAEYERVIDMDFHRDPFAVDAVVFIVPKESPRTSISVEEIKNELYSDNKKLIFDGTNSSNLNFIAQKLNVQPKDLKYSIISGNTNVIQELNKYPDKIGVIGLNTISRPYAKEAIELRDKVKILSLTQNGKSYDPSGDGLRNLEYPFARILYLINNEGPFGIARGIVRFSCTQKGQIVVEKEGLQPYNLFNRVVEMR